MPASPHGTGDDADPGVLTLDVEGYGADEQDLEHIDWDSWFEKFDSNDLVFLYQQEKADGDDSTFFKLVCKDSVDAG